MKLKLLIKRKILYEGICLLLVLNFFYEAVQKLAYWEVYRFWMSHAPLIRNWAVVLKYMVPVIELMIVVFLVIQKLQRVAFYSIMYVVKTI